MQKYWLTDRTSGETTLVDADTVEQLLEVEFGYVEWCIGEVETTAWEGALRAVSRHLTLFVG